MTVRSDLIKKDEIGSVVNASNKLASHFDITLTKVQGSSATINNATNFLNTITTKSFDFARKMAVNCNNVAEFLVQTNTNMSAIAAASEQAASNVNMVAAASEEMSSTINEISINAQKAKEISQISVQESAVATKSVQELGQAAEQINKVTETIKTIAEQTNLLALNATIEAARAGSAGKGFAVVANEIKELAKQTSYATNEIKEQIEGVQSSSRKTIDVIKKITSTIDNTSEIVSTIASAVTEQATATGEISSNVNQASTGIVEVTENITQASSANSEIAHDINNIQAQADKVATNSLDIRELTLEMQSNTQILNSIIEHFKFRPSNFDIGSVKASHFNWKMRLTSVLEGFTQLKKDEIADHNECEFGQWLKTAPERLRNSRYFNKVISNHEIIHRLVFEVLDLYNQGQPEKAHAKVDEFESIRKKLFRDLDELYLI